MKCTIGMDIGAVSLTAALLVDGPVTLPAEHFSPAGRHGAFHIYLSSYRRTRGRPIETATELLDEVAKLLGPEAIAGVCVTGSAGALVAQKLSCQGVNEFKGIVTGLSVLGIKARTVFEMGGQTSKYMLLDGAENGYAISDYATNGDCAAGTGSFIDQQAGRLQFATEQVGRVALEAQRTAQVAGRCSVFAKSDMIHAQQKGYTPAEVLAGLCMAVARNFRMAVVRSHRVEAPVVFIGGLAANQAVVKALGEVFELGEKEFSVPAGYAHAGAAGAASLALRSVVGVSTDLGPACLSASLERGTDNAEKQAPPRSVPEWSFNKHLADLRSASDSTHGQFPTAEPLSMHRVLLLRDQVTPYELPYGEQVDAYLGIDIGSVSTNVVLIDTEGSVIRDIYTRTLGRPVEVVTQAMRDLYEDVGDRVIIRGVGTTGSGRELIGELVGADTINDEITAHKTGSTFIGDKMLNGRKPDTIFEIGGQDSKFIALQDGVVVDFMMNEACAAGTGSFLEERAEELDISIINEFAELALSSTAPIRLGERCTVFMERDVMDYLQRGAFKADLVAGLAYSVVYNYINRVVRGRHIGQTVFFQGGTAYNDAVAAAFSAVLGKEVIVPPYNGVMGAIGSALLARDKMLSNGRLANGPPAADRLNDTAPNGKPEGKSLGSYIPEGKREPNRQSSIENRQSQSRFRGYDMTKVDYSLREFTCKGCSNQCIMQEFNVEGEKTYWGDKCSDRYRKVSKAATKPVIDDLFSYREKLLNDDSDCPPAPADALSIGIPRAMFALDHLPFWRTFWRRCGFNVKVSSPTNRGIVAAGTAKAVAEPCFPVIVAHGHVNALIEDGIDYIFIPNIVSAATTWMGNESYLCPWNQTLPFVVRRVPDFEEHIHKFLTPNIQFRLGEKFVAKAAREMAVSVGVKPDVADAALAAAYRTQGRFGEQLRAAGHKALADLRRAGAPGIVIIGRPYNIHDAGVNLSVARKLRDYYGVNCIPIDCLDLAGVDARSVNSNMYWDYGRKLLAAGRIVGEDPLLHIIHITNFKCGPDSYVKHFIRTASGKPFLSLQFDGHSNDAGMMTRCEAYLDSKGILRPWKKAGSAEDATVAV